MNTAEYRKLVAKHEFDPRVMLSARVKPHLVAALESLRPVLKVKRSEMVERAIEEYVESRLALVGHVQPDFIAQLEALVPKGRRHADLVESAVREYIERHAPKKR